MRSSISSSDRHSDSGPLDRTLPPDREVPDRPWSRVGALALAGVALAVAAVELTARSAGYDPSYLDSKDFFAERRRAVEPDGLVAIGSSRMSFDFDLDVVEAALGRRPVQLALAGSSPVPVLAELAADASFAGDVIVGVTPPLLFAGGGPPIERILPFVEHVPRQSPSSRSGHWLAQRLQEVFAFLNEDLTLRMLLDAHVRLPERPGFRAPPGEPPSFGILDAERRVRMVPEAEVAPLRDEVRASWQAILGSVPEMPPEIVEAGRQQVLETVSGHVDAIRGRGGRVLFVRFPSTGWFREIEAKMTPRETYWDALLERTSAPGVHFEDHPELADFDCPEWSHLTAADAERFTRALVPHLEAWLR